MPKMWKTVLCSRSGKALELTKPAASPPQRPKGVRATHGGQFCEKCRRLMSMYEDHVCWRSS